MNDDELRAFLDSATVGDDKQDGEAGAAERDGARGAEGAEDSDAGSLDLPPTEPIFGLPHQGADSDQGASAAPAKPSFAELIGGLPPSAIPREPEAPAAATTAQAAAAGSADDAELVPIVLPAPPSSTTPAPRPAAAAPRTSPPVPSAAPVPAAAPATQLLPQSDGLGDSSAQLTATLGLGAVAADTGSDGYEKISVTGGEKEHRRALPWIIVAAVAVVALVAALIVVFAMRGGGDTPPVATPETQSPTTPAEPTTPSEEPTTEPETPTDPADEAPTVDVGPNPGAFPIPDWNLSGKISAKLGWPQYRIEGDNLILFGGTLLPQFPESCKAMREGFGLTKHADGSLTVLRPAERCAEAPELYDEVWGLTAATIPTFEKG